MHDDSNPLIIRIVETLARVEAKVDGLAALDASKSKELAEQAARIAKLEHGRSWLMGACAAVAAISSLIVKVLSA